MDLISVDNFSQSSAALPVIDALQSNTLSLEISRLLHKSAGTRWIRSLEELVLANPFPPNTSPSDWDDLLNAVTIHLTFDLLHRIFRKGLGVLREVKKHCGYWKSLQNSPIHYLLQKGPLYWLKHLTPTRLRAFSLSSWKFKVERSGSDRIRSHIAALESIEKNITALLEAVYQHMCALRSVDLEGFRSHTSFALETFHAIAEVSPFVVLKRNYSSGRLALNERCDAFECVQSVAFAIRHMDTFAGVLKSRYFDHRRPSHLQRYWIQYCFFGSLAAVALITAARDWAKLKSAVNDMVAIAKDFVHEHLLEPTRNIYERLSVARKTNSSRQRAFQELVESKKSLERMLRDYGHYVIDTKVPDVPPAGVELSEYAKKSSGEKALAWKNDVDARSKLLDMNIVMKTYEEQVARPLSSIASGDLIRGVLIQVQKLKVGTEEAIVEMDVLLEENGSRIHRRNTHQQTSTSN